MAYLRDFWRISFSLAKANFKLRNEGSYLGIFWYLLSPILMFSLLFLVFSDRLGNNIPYYPLYLLMGIIMFNFFQQTTIESTFAIRNNSGIIKSINFPREAIIGSIVIKNLFSHLFEIILFLGVMAFFGVSLFSIAYYVIIIFFFCFFVFGFCLALSAISAYFTDLDGIWNFVVRLLWLGTPIFYAIEGQTRLYYANLLNPIYYFIYLSRDLVIYSSFPEIWIILNALIFSLSFLIAGLIIFNKLKYRFAELI